MLQPDQPAEEGMDKNPLDPALDQAGPSTPAETTAVEPTVLDKTKKRYPVPGPSCDSVRERNIRAGEKSDERIQVESVL